MGRQQGLVSLTGQYGSVQLRITADGIPVAAFAPKKSGKRVKTGENYRLTRQNNDEFTGSAYSASALRKCFGERVRQFSDRVLYPRLVKLTYAMLKRGPGPGGKRSFEVGPNVDLLRYVELNARDTLTNRFMARYTVTVNPSRDGATLDVPAFNPDHYLRPPVGATHYRLLLVAGVLSDYVHVGGNMPYEAVNPLLNGLSTVAESALIPAMDVVSAPLQLVATIAGSPVMPTTASLVVCVGIEFYRVINTYEGLMAQGNAMCVVEVG